MAANISMAADHSVSVRFFLRFGVRFRFGLSPAESIEKVYAEALFGWSSSENSTNLCSHILPLTALGIFWPIGVPAACVGRCCASNGREIIGNSRASAVCCTWGGAGGRGGMFWLPEVEVYVRGFVAWSCSVFCEVVPRRISVITSQNTCCCFNIRCWVCCIWDKASTTVDSSCWVFSLPVVVLISASGGILADVFPLDVPTIARNFFWPVGGSVGLPGSETPFLLRVLGIFPECK